MKRRRPGIAVLLLGLAVVLAACARSEPDAQDQAEQTQPATFPEAGSPSSQQIAEGELQNVDLDGMTFVLADSAGNPQLFSFSESTEVAGASGAQGLSGRQGSHVRVRYMQQGDLRSAVRIELTQN